MDKEKEYCEPCPECGQDINTTEDVCPLCGYDLRDVHAEEVEELLTEIDDDTFELKGGDVDALLEKIKHFAPKDEVNKRLREKREREHPMTVFECPLCGTDVREDATECPGCGAIFED